MCLHREYLNQLTGSQFLILSLFPTHSPSSAAGEGPDASPQMRLSRFLRIQNPWSLFSKARWCCLKGGKRWCRRILCLWYLQFTRWGLKSTAQHPGCCSLSPVNIQEKKLNYLNLSGGIRQAALPREATGCSTDLSMISSGHRSDTAKGQEENLGLGCPQSQEHSVEWNQPSTSPFREMPGAKFEVLHWQKLNTQNFWWAENSKYRISK